MKVEEFLDKLKDLRKKSNSKKILGEVDALLSRDTINDKYTITTGFYSEYVSVSQKKMTLLEYLLYTNILDSDLLLEVLSMVIAKGGDPNIYNQDAQPLVVVACERHLIAVAKALIKGGADVNVQYGLNKLTPLMVITVSMPTYPNQYEEDDTPNYDPREKFSYLDLFLSSDKLDINIKNENGQDAFMFAIANARPVEADYIFQSISQYELPYNFNAQDVNKDTVLFSAIKAFNLSPPNEQETLCAIIEMLIRVPTLDLEITDQFDDTPLFLASSYNNPRIVELFFLEKSRYPKIDAVHKKTNQTALNKAVIKDNLGVVEVLLKNSANTEIPDIEGDTPLLSAVDGENIAIITALLEAGASKDTKNKEGVSALDLAKESKNREVQELFDINVPLWKGSSRSDIQKYDIFFEKPFEWSTCPVCLDYVERSSGCMFIMDHDCAKTGHYYHRELYNKYVSESPTTGTPMIEWCTVCGRITEFHKHFKLVSANSDKPDYAPIKPDLQQRLNVEHDNTAFYDNKNCIGFGGGGLEEKAARFRRLREYALELQDDVRKKTHKAAMKELIEETWNAPFYRTKKVKEVIEQKKYNISPSKFPTVVYNTPREDVATPTPTDIPYTGKLPIKLDAATHSCVIGTSDHEGDESNPVYNFQHLEQGGVDHTDLLICVDDLTDAIKDKNRDFGTLRFGKCWVESCNATLHPAELEHIVPDAVYKEYKKKFNKKMAAVGGRRSATRKNKYSKISVMHPLDLSTITCLNPPVKRSTLKSKKSSQRRSKKK